ncbi:hypothetical protein PhCBS80983_g02990 [Powellomyces hirtus]|uniref:ER membrane protein complex subunit 10 n=1 Tax=Powellomyces hirtus TaxID=109895 RepID=A0A507E5N3_9FUNG|nr:hypothetical protein PhCBS80983_g02990 [Powellomyces hirtus]
MQLPSILISAVLLACGFAASVAEPIELSVSHSLGSAKPTPRGSLIYDPASPKRSANKYIPGAAAAGAVDSGDDDGLYRVYVEGNGVRLTAAVPLCMLTASGYQEQMTLHLDSKGVPWHLDYLVSATSCDIPKKKQLPRTPKTQVFTETALAGARPKLEQIVVTTPDGKPPAEQTFLQKYWFYIIPVMVMFLMNSGAEEPAKK